MILKNYRISQKLKYSQYCENFCNINQLFYFYLLYESVNSKLHKRIEQGFTNKARVKGKQSCSNSLFRSRGISYRGESVNRKQFWKHAHVLPIQCQGGVFDRSGPSALTKLGPRSGMSQLHHAQFAFLFLSLFYLALISTLREINKYLIYKYSQKRINSTMIIKIIVQFAYI